MCDHCVGMLKERADVLRGPAPDKRREGVDAWPYAGFAGSADSRFGVQGLNCRVGRLVSSAQHHTRCKRRCAGVLCLAEARDPTLVNSQGPRIDREQLSAQLLLGILSRRLAPGERLPSVRELARRLAIHSNTVSAAYQDLAAHGWVEMRRGSGVLVKDVSSHAPEEGIRSFVSAWVEHAGARGYSIDQLQAELSHCRSRPANFIVADPDIELARILAAEITEATGLPISAESCIDRPLTVPHGTLVLITSGKAGQIGRLLAGAPTHLVRLKSMQEVLAGRIRPASPALIAVVSRSHSVLSWATPLLAALGFAPESVLLRNSCDARWREGLHVCDIVASDICAIPQRYAAGINHTVFRIVSDESLREIRQLVTA